MSQELSQAAVDVLCAAQDADVEPTTSLATISAAAIRAAVKCLSQDRVITEEGFKGVRREIVETIDADDMLALAAELEGPL